jgi:hypothetical protein
MMNERIEKLLEQCQIETYGVNGELLEIGFDAEKFAELIVRECADVVYSRSGHATPQDLYEHFGVKE